ncbi:unnamed protein product, partial [Medioppia subpectinata]
LSRNGSNESISSSPSYSQRSAPVDDLSSTATDESSPLHHHFRPRSNTLSEIADISADTGADDRPMTRSESLAVHNRHSASGAAQPKPKPLLNIFMKVGSKSNLNLTSDTAGDKLSGDTGSASPKSAGNSQPSGQSWRQSIFNRIHGGGTGSDQKRAVNTVEKSSVEMSPMGGHRRARRRTRQELRELWRSAIRQQMLLNKMDKQNQSLQDDRIGTYDKRMKLDYDEIPNFSDATQLWDATKRWDSLCDDHRHRNHAAITYERLFNAIQLGVPRHKKGEVWLFLSQYYKCVNNDNNNNKCFNNCINNKTDNKDNDSVNADTPYRQLLGQLATQQHAILVDLGESRK